MALPAIAAYMLSCPERAAIREESVRSFRATDWGAPIVIHINEAREGLPVQRMAEGALKLLQMALAGESDYFLVCEDDVLFDPKVRAGVEAWEPLRAGVVGMASLYNPGAPGKLWRQPSAGAMIIDAEVALGSQARLFSRACAELIVREFRPSAWGHDVAMGRMAERCGPLLYHVPSLVQHIGRESTWGGPFHEAWDWGNGKVEG